MKLAVICPPQDLENLPYHLGYQMALAQYVLRDDKYEDHMKGHAYKGSFIMLDNGAAEGELLSVPDLMRAADSIDADEIILPDKLKDGDTTLKMHTQNDVLTAIHPKRRVVVIQGRTFYDVKKFLKALNRMSDWFYFNTIAIPKHFEAISGGRAKILKYLVEQGFALRYNIHLLGIYEKPFEEVLRAYRVYKGIRGIDTAAPVAYAQFRTRLNDIFHYSLSWRRSADPTVMERNIIHYLMFCRKEQLENELEGYRSRVRQMPVGQATFRYLEETNSFKSGVRW